MPKTSVMRNLFLGLIAIFFQIKSMIGEGISKIKPRIKAPKLLLQSISILSLMAFALPDVSVLTICGVGEANHQSLTSDISVLPNPANDYFVVRIGHPFEQGRYMLFNAVGQVVRDENLSGTEVYVSAAGLPAGVYHLAIQLDGKASEVTKVLISY